MDRISIIDFGSQYTRLIARRIREIGVYSEILSPYGDYLPVLKENSVKGIILSGGPMSVYDKDAPKIKKEIFYLKKPVLGICYGLQLIAHLFNGKVERSREREYGFASFEILKKSSLFEGIKRKNWTVWMSHGDSVSKLPLLFRTTGKTESTPFASFENNRDKIYALQFHPEVVHTDYGKRILKNFVINICNAKKEWDMGDFIRKTISELKEKYSDKPCVCALSGGVDSSVLSFMLKRAFENNFYPIFVDTGLMKNEEGQRVKALFKDFKNLRIVNTSSSFIRALRGIKEPEKKRKIIGKLFIDVFIKEVLKILKTKKFKKGEKLAYLFQGTLYPDVIESRPFVGPSSTIKTHHNVGGLPPNHPFIILEPFRELFKDEVRKIGRKLGLPDEIITRHPFPGPGYGVRIIGEVNREKLQILRFADAIFEEEIRKEGLYEKLWQAFCVLLPCKSVGVMGDERTYEYTIVLRAVESQDAMTANWAGLSASFLDRVARRIVGEVRGVNRVLYDITSKPPATIEWE